MVFLLFRKMRAWIDIKCLVSMILWNPFLFNVSGTCDFLLTQRIQQKWCDSSDSIDYIVKDFPWPHYLGLHRRRLGHIPSLLAWCSKLPSWGCPRGKELWAAFSQQAAKSWAPWNYSLKEVTSANNLKKPGSEFLSSRIFREEHGPGKILTEFCETLSIGHTKLCHTGTERS